jgi:3,4-dihydroxy 2-butanone 4-phosphate synthase/GTP cyclohydrolase II
MAQKFGMKLITIKDLIAYRMEHESLVKEVIAVNMPTIYGDFTLHAFEESLTGDHHLALVKGEWDEDEPVLVRVHSSSPLGDIFGSRLSDKTELLHQAMKMVEKEGKGVVLYMDQMNRNFGIVNQLKALQLMQDGLSRDQIEDKIGIRMDYRDYGVGAQIIHTLGVRKVKLLTNNPVKRVGVRSFGLEMVEEVPIPLNYSEPGSLNTLGKEGFIKSLNLD